MKRIPLSTNSLYVRSTLICCVLEGAFLSAHVCAPEYMHETEDHFQNSALLLPPGSWESSSGHWARQQAPFPVTPQWTMVETSNHLLPHIVLTSAVYSRRTYTLLFLMFKIHYCCLYICGGGHMCGSWMASLWVVSPFHPCMGSKA